MIQFLQYEFSIMGYGNMFTMTPRNTSLTRGSTGCDTNASEISLYIPTSLSVNFALPLKLPNLIF